jgi:L-ascorbate metabolism protein UlaG (beta-lactamase superfamily)
MDWTEQREVNINNKIFKLTFVPVCHWSRRGLFDHNHRLWGGFVIESPTGKKVFYSGDTGYCEIFKELTKVFGSFDLCILPIGAYLPR